jgi:hypothetical protein
MSLAVSFSQNKGELIKINICRIYPQAISMSDICNFDGTHITQQTYDGTFVMKNPNICWPNQRRISKGGWLVWRWFLGSIADGNRYIFQPLGKRKELAVLHHDHEWYIATPHRALIQKRGNQWFLHERQGHRNKLYASPKLRSIAHTLNVSTTLPSHNPESNTFYSIAHGEPNISTSHLTNFASSDHVHLCHNASKIYHHLPIFDLQVMAPFFTPLDTTDGL